VFGLSLGFGSGCGDASPPPDEHQYAILVHFEVAIATQVIECSVIRGVDVFPLEAWADAPIELRAIAPEDEASITWHATSGHFSDPFSAETEYFCNRAGEQTLTATLAEGTLCEQSVEVEVTCSTNPLCGDGHLDDDEQCDDGNMDYGDGCSDLCRIEVD
jgi:cysteine-rich repeat protein